MMTRVARLMTAAVLTLCTLSTSAPADEMDIPLDQVPKPVMDSAKAKFPGAEMRGAAKETEDNQTFYEISMTHQNHKMDVAFKPDGTLALVETELPEREVPAAITQAVKAKYLGAKIDLTESVQKGPAVKKEVDYYELHLTTADNKSVEVEVDPQGKILKSEAGEKD
jgi:uncharacterized membrane protein YkoI